MIGTILNEEIGIINTPLVSSSWYDAMGKADEMLKANTNQQEASCLIPNLQRTEQLLFEREKEQQVNKYDNYNGNDFSGSERRVKSLVPLPVLNVGFPKTGSTTLHQFFVCAGYESRHWMADGELIAVCMRDAAEANLPPLETCVPDVEAVLQMDAQFPFGYEYANHNHRQFAYQHRDECYFPQLSLLEQIHEENPNATFIMNFRPIQDWVTSMLKWYGMMERIQSCHLPNLPYGQPRGYDFSSLKLSDVTTTTTTNIKNNINNNNQNGESNDNGSVSNDGSSTSASGTIRATDLLRDDVKRFFCSHVIHVRNFVERFPSHTLIELDLYDTNATSRIMNLFFQHEQHHQPSSSLSNIVSINSTTTTAVGQLNNCWKHRNKSNATHVISNERLIMRRKRRKNRIKQRKFNDGKL